ncbi:MAG: CDP-diacylglycerol--serine O-phosphatidyltransferase [Paracoccaceae bacterium]
MRGDEDQAATRSGDMPLIRMLPNLMTVAALCAGMTAIRFAVQGNFRLSVGLIVVAAVLDGLDGRIARRLKSESPLGAELDSLCDFVNFGVAPAMITYYFAKGMQAPLGWTAALIYAVCCLMRLARFNIGSRNISPDNPKRDFVGVPSPAGAMLLFLPVFVALFAPEWPRLPGAASSVYMVLIGALMISRMPTPAFKALRIRPEYARYVLVGFVGLLAVALTYPWAMLILLDLAYITVVIAFWLKSGRKTRMEGEQDGT